MFLGSEIHSSVGRITRGSPLAYTPAKQLMRDTQDSQTAVLELARASPTFIS